MAFITAALAGATASIAGGAATLAPIISAGAGIASIAGAFKGGNNIPLPQSQQLPTVPEYAKIQMDEKNKILRANQNRTKTILTNPLGEVDSIVKTKQLVSKLGQ